MEKSLQVFFSFRNYKHVISICDDIMKNIITCRNPTVIFPLNTSDEDFGGQDKQDPAERIALFDRDGRHMRSR